MLHGDRFFALLQVRRPTDRPTLSPSAARLSRGAAHVLRIGGRDAIHSWRGRACTDYPNSVRASSVKTCD